MKLLFAFLFFAVNVPFLLSCANNATAGVTNSAVAANPTSATPTGGNASFLYRIEGRTISGKGSEPGVNIARRTTDGRIRFVLMSLDVTQKAPPQFDFAVNDHGTTTITADDMDRHRSGDGKIFADFSIPPLQTVDPIPNYEFATHISVTLLSVTSSRITGVFSGDLFNPVSKIKVPLTDGIFDLPFSATK